jgi:hypothetical protein
MGKSLLSLNERRPLGIALAHTMVVCKPGRDIGRLLILNRLFAGSKPLVQVQCRGELARCRAAVRGELLAMVP